MTQEEVLNNARTCLGPYCKGCPVCNGRACKNIMPGPGSKGGGGIPPSAITRNGGRSGFRWIHSARIVRWIPVWKFSERPSPIRFLRVRWAQSTFITEISTMTRLIMIFWCVPARTTALRLYRRRVRTRRSCGRLPQPSERQREWEFRP